MNAESSPPIARAMSAIPAVVPVRYTMAPASRQKLPIVKHAKMVRANKGVMAWPFFVAGCSRTRERCH